MLTIIKILILSCTITVSAWPCQMKNQKVVSLSSSVTHLFKKLQRDQNLKAVSAHHLISKRFSGTKIPGGIHFSGKTLESFKDTLIFYDQSFELERVLKNNNIKNIQSVKTLMDNPFQQLDTVITQISPLLVNCQNQIMSIQKQYLKLQKKIDEMPRLKKRYIFHLGEVGGHPKTWKLFLTNDLFLAYLRKANKITTYPSDLAYTVPAQKIMNELKAETVIMIGLLESDDYLTTKVQSNSYNISGPASLQPGVTHLDFFNYLIDQLITIDSKF